MWHHQWMSLTCVTMLLIPLSRPEGLLYPVESESRAIHSLNGIWDFRAADQEDSAEGHRKGWYKSDLKQTGDIIPMPVPASYNDITQDKSLRDHVGVVWYDRTFYTPVAWNSGTTKVWLRIGSVHYAADVFINGEQVVHHEGGHIPFQVDITSSLLYGEKNRISVAVNNTLTSITVPQGTLSNLHTDEGTKVIQMYDFDFFNYAGIHRSVLVYTTPSAFIDDISVNTDIESETGTGTIDYKVDVGGESSGTPVVSVSLLDRDGNYVVQDVQGLQGVLKVPQAKLWWPYLMASDPAYLYTLEVRLSAGGDVPEDVYRLRVGIRKLEWSSTGVTINGKPIYMRGFGRHEDSDIRGKGLDLPLIARDYNLIKWLGANAYRTTHYPYSEEIMDFADKEGIMIIDECPSVKAQGFADELLEAHKTALTRLHRRDKNRPSVVMWSVANEALTETSGADTYFSAIADHIKTLDPSRPITTAIFRTYTQDKVGQFMDVICFNRYNGWYINGGQTDAITFNVVDEVRKWHEKYNKPVIISEYGADTMTGLHLSPEYIWSEEYQVKVFSKHFQAFDQLRKEGIFIGEMVWNFADFKTDETYIRVGGNRKGILTRDRQPKEAALLIRKRYWGLAQLLDNADAPEDLFDYITEETTQRTKTEL